MALKIPYFLEKETQKLLLQTPQKRLSKKITKK